MCAAFLDRPNWPIRTTGGCNDGSLGRSKNAAHTQFSTLFIWIHCVVVQAKDDETSYAFIQLQAVTYYYQALLMMI